MPLEEGASPIVYDCADILTLEQRGTSMNVCLRAPHDQMTILKNVVRFASTSMCRRARGLFLSLLTASALLTPWLASRSTAQVPFRFARGQSVFVVAVRTVGDSAVLQACSTATGSPTRPSPSWRGLELVPPGVELLAGGIPDTDLRTQVENLLRKYGRFTPVASVDQANLVLVVQIHYGSAQSASFSRSNGPGGTSSPVLVTILGTPDMPRPTPVALLAIAVPGTVWRTGAHDGEPLVNARVWQGSDRNSDPKGVSPAALIEAFSKHPDQPYVPPHSSNRPTRFDETPGVDDRSPVGSQLNDQQPRPEPVRPGSLNTAYLHQPMGVCASPLPPRAPHMGPAVSENPTLPDKAGAGLDVVPTPARPPTAATFTTGVVAVAVPLVATGPDGAPAAGLTAADFRVYQDGAEQRMAQLLTESAPLRVALLLDVSDSMRARVESIRAAASAFVDALRPEDAVMVASFSGQTFINCEFTRDRAVARQAIVQTRVQGTGSRLYDALDALLTERFAAVQGRKVLVVLTDGMDIDSAWATAQSAVERVQSANVAVYALQCDTTRDPRPGPPTILPRGTKVEGTGPWSFDVGKAYEAGRRFLADLAHTSGGRVEDAAMPEEIAQTLARIAEEVRRQYVLYYYPSTPAGDGAFHTIRVESSRPGVTIRARTGYRAQ
jgi:Ca-activated chloride channel family protein